MIKHSILTKFSLLCLLVFTVTLSSSILLFEHIYTRQYTKNILDASSRTLYSMNSSLNSLVQEVSTFSRSVLANQTLRELIKNNNENYNSQNDVRLETALYNLSLSTDKITSLNVFDLDGRHYSYHLKTAPINTFYRDHYQTELWYKKVNQLAGAPVIYIWPPKYESTSFNGISIIRQLNDTETFKEIGLISIDIGTEVLETVFEPFTEKYDASLFLVDSNNKLIAQFSSQSNSVWDEIRDDISKNNNSFITLNSRQYILDKTQNDSTGLTLVSLSPSANISDELTYLKLRTLWILIGGVLISTLGILLVINQLLKPVRALTCSMVHVIENKEFVPVSIKTSQDEIGTLKDIYNQMIEQIQLFLSLSIKEEKLKRKNEMKALQAQIKPHFLYNTFDAISSLALQGKNDLVYHALQQLSSFYRLSLSNGQEYLPLKNEIQLVKQYSEILKIRRPDSFEIFCEIAPETEHFVLPKLTLQPFVENSLHHGIFPLGEPGNIMIRSQIKNDCFLISIEDNGIGMSKEKIDYLLGTTSSTGSFGAKSTIERIRLLYGEKAEIKINSTLNKGTSVTIILPLNGEIEL